MIEKRIDTEISVIGKNVNEIVILQSQIDLFFLSFLNKNNLYCSLRIII